MPYTVNQIAALRSTISAEMRLAIFEAMSGPERHKRLWFVVEELDSLGQIDGLKDALPGLRKFGCRCLDGIYAPGVMPMPLFGRCPDGSAEEIGNR